MTVYCDTNFLVRLFADLPESARVEARLGTLRGRIPITWLHRIELPNALQQMVFLSRSGGPVRMTPENALLALARFEEEVLIGRRLAAASVATDDLVRQARELTLRHTARHGFRTYDTAHVATALLLDSREFWSFDAKASRLAAIEGMKVL